MASGLKIVRVYAGSPARRAGLQPNDIIVRAAGKPLAGLSSQAASALIRGPKGTKVRVELSRGGAKLTKDVGRDEVRIPIVTSRYDADQRVGIVRLASFASGAHGQIASAIDALRKRGAKGVVLDLRSNPVWLVEEALRTSSLFLKGGTVVTTKGRA